MKTKFLLAIIAFCGLLFLGACQPQTVSDSTQTSEINQAYPIATQTSYSPGYPAPVTQVKQTAFEAYPIAEEKAKEWNPDAVIAGIPATFMMEINLGYPGIGSGWFFMFKVDGQPLEYYVMVDNGVVAGVTEAQPVVVGERAFEYRPLPPLDKMIDSDHFLEIFKKNGGDKYLSDNPDAMLNPQLYFLSTNEFPIWSVYDVSKGTSAISLFDVNALTGEPITQK